MLDPGFQEFMRRSNLRLQNVVVEITEYTALSHLRRYPQRSPLTHREQGMRFAVDDAQAALRQLYCRLVGILHGCLKTRTCYDETVAWAHQNRAAS